MYIRQHPGTGISHREEKKGRYWGSDGTAVWGADSDTQYAQMKGAGASAAGTAGLAPAPPAGTANRYLRSDGTWAVPPDTAPEEATTADIDQIIAGTFTS